MFASSKEELQKLHVTNKDLLRSLIFIRLVPNYIRGQGLNCSEKPWRPRKSGCELMRSQSMAQLSPMTSEGYTPTKNVARSNPEEAPNSYENDTMPAVKFDRLV